MFTSNRYWQIVILTASGQYKVQESLQAKSWFQSSFATELIQSNPEDREIQTALWEVWTSRSDSASMAYLCLRCWVSQQILRVCQQLGNQFGSTYGFTAAELWPFVLDDDGQPNSSYLSFSQTILKKYDPRQAALSTWTHRMTKSHQDIKQFCLDRGLYCISDWAILNDTSLNQLSRVLSGISESVLAETMTLLAAYHRVYRQARFQQRLQKGKSGRCLEPTEAQLSQINPNMPPKKVLNQLYELADQLRQYRIAVRRGMPLAQPLDIDSHFSNLTLIANDKDDAEQAQDDFINCYRANLLASLDDAIRTVALAYTHTYQRKKPPKGQVYLAALNLFHCQGLTMAEIAREVALASQVQVTRLLNLKRFRAEVCTYWFNQLKPKVTTEALEYISPKQLDHISHQVENVLVEATETVMAEAAAEAQMPKNRTMNSMFFRRLCHILPNLRPPDI